MTKPLDIVVLGLSLSSSWGNGHATTWRALLRGVAALGHRVTFLERDVPWYASHRDLAQPDFCALHLYADLDALRAHDAAIRDADAVIVGSYVPDGPAVIDHVLETARGVVGFYDIDTPVTLAQLARGETPSLETRQIPLFDVYFSFTGGPTLDLLERTHGARAARALYCSVEEERYRPTGEAFEWDLGYLGTYAPDRQPALERLLIEPARRLPDKRFVVAGPQYPEEVDWPANVTRIPHLPPAEHASFYSRQRFTLNVTRADMVAAGWSPSVRLFEAGACATAIIGDAWEGLDTLLPDGEAMLVAREPEDVVSILTELPAMRRDAIAAAGRARVLAAHTGVARARELVAMLAQASAERETASGKKVAGL
ncbi:CgeB family protein [Salinarimonas ramus]|uniref:Glycosyl transferase n=1 Tax=Salinarimonas ramus TaxID=690164 RepID=A0A917QD22_9HYPH|nr:glycosyltransferase [Salinarimonas ramus]GGK44876.1 glycosyl transferase [Salinarimonas ramus]